MAKKVSETVTENIFREFYGASTFLEKSAIPNEYGFKSKNKTSKNGYPDFFYEDEDYLIVVEAKAANHEQAIEEVKFYLLNNNIDKDLIGIAVSGQREDSIKADYFLKQNDLKEIKQIIQDSELLSLNNIHKIFWKERYGETIADEALNLTLNRLNNVFNDNNKVKDTERSLFFSGLMIALKDNTFRKTFRYIEAPTEQEIASTKETILEAHNLNEAILNAITNQIADKINNLSKSYSWKDRFSFIRNIDFSLLEYKDIISTIEMKIFKPFKNEEKQDILGKAYRIFLKKAGKIDNKNIILTPDHIKSLMIDLSRLSVNDVVIDTCTGSGGFLMESMEVLIKKANKNASKISHIKNKQLIGFETDPVLFALACSNMFLHGDGRTNLLFRSSLLYDKNQNIVNNKDRTLLAHIKSLKPTKCIINPPYEKNNAIKFTHQALKYLEPNGKLIIIMPTPTLTSNQSKLTKEILKIAKLDFVIKMPYKLFSEQKRTVNTSVFGFTKTPHSQTDEVLFYNLKDDGFESIQHKGRVDKDNKWADKKNTVLNTIFNSKEIKGICEKRKIYKNGIWNCAGFQESSRPDATMVQVKDIFKIKKGTLASTKNEEGDYVFITGSEEWKTHSEYTNDEEALVYVTKAGGSLGRCHYVNGKFTASNLCLVLTPKNPKKYPVNLNFYQAYFNNLREKIVDDLADGTSKLTIKDDMLKKYYINYIPIETQNSFVTDYIIGYKSKLKKLKNLVKEADIELNENLEKII